MKKSLREYTDEELYEFMEKNMITDTSELSCYCSEILRRLLKPPISGESSVSSE